MILAKIRVMPLAAITGIFMLSTPYTNHMNVPKVNNEYIDSEMPVVLRVLIVCTAWGIKDMVVPIAAIIPVVAVISIAAKIATGVHIL